MKEIALPLSILILAATQVPGALRDTTWNNCVKYASESLRKDKRMNEAGVSKIAGLEIFTLLAVRDCNGGGADRFGVTAETLLGYP